MASQELFSYIFIAVARACGRSVYVRADVALAVLTGLIQHVIKVTFADRRWMCLNGGWEMSLAFFMGRVINQSVEQMDFFTCWQCWIKGVLSCLLIL